MSYFHTCPLCGANLDPCEKCDCENRMSEDRERAFLSLIADFSDAEKRELLLFIQQLEAGLSVTVAEAYEMGRQAGRRARAQ